MNKRIFITVGVVGDDITTLYLGTSKGKARDAFLANRLNTDFDFVGSQVVPGFRSRSRPRVLESEEAARLEKSIALQEAEISRIALEKKAKKVDLVKAALEVEESEAEAVARLKELAAKRAGKKGKKDKKTTPAEDLEPEGEPAEDLAEDLEPEGAENPEDDGLDDLVK